MIDPKSNKKTNLTLKISVCEEVAEKFPTCVINIH